MVYEHRNALVHLPSLSVAYAGIPKGPGHCAEGRIPIGGGAVRWSLARGAPSLARGRRHRREGRHRWSQGRRHWLKGRHYWRKRRRAAVTGWKELFFFNQESPNEVPDDYHVLNDVWNGPSRTIHMNAYDSYLDQWFTNHLYQISGGADLVFFSSVGGSAWAPRIQRDRACPECPVRPYATDHC